MPSGIGPRLSPLAALTRRCSQTPAQQTSPNSHLECPGQAGSHVQVEVHSVEDSAALAARRGAVALRFCTHERLLHSVLQGVGMGECRRFTACHFQQAAPGEPQRRGVASAAPVVQGRKAVLNPLEPPCRSPITPSHLSVCQEALQEQQARA